VTDVKLLALDTSTEACSAALMIGTEMRERFEVAPREHGRLILPMIESLLAEADLPLSSLDALAFGRGPGGFTGVRIATGVVQGLAFGADLPVVPVSTLAALAQGALREAGASEVLAAIDARISEVYWGAYRAGAGGLMVLVGEERVCRPAEAPLPPPGQWYGTGTGWGAYSEELQHRLGAQIARWDGQRLPHARDVAALGLAGLAAGCAVPAERALPVYLRDQVAWRKPAP
jgi:tRNA threonylcarbamoyladenosine biosynthesis protein TsaB